MDPKIHKLWEYGPNYSTARLRLFVYKSEYNKLLKEVEELKFDLSLSELSRKAYKTPTDPRQKIKYYDQDHRRT
jgi:hypothetical protein